MKVFISWSGERGNYIADCLSRMLSSVNFRIETWVSTKLQPGAEWSQELNNELRAADVGIFIVTPEGLQSKWVNYEAGFLRSSIGPNGHIIPVCFEVGTDELTDSPLSQFQAAAFDAENIRALMKQLNELVPDPADRRRSEDIDRTFESIWQQEFLSHLNKIEKIPLSYNYNFQALLQSLSYAGLGEVKFTNSYLFESGFEDWSLYEAIFKQAKKRLWVLGRKNRKSFDKSFKWFFETLDKDSPLIKDLRFMFLSPDAGERVISKAHQDADFPEQLARSIQHGRKRIEEFGLSADDHFRFYRSARNHHIIVCDDAVLFSPINLDKDGRAESITNSKFQIVDSGSSIGKDFIEQCEMVWANGDRDPKL